MRIQVFLNDDLVKKIDVIASSIGTSRSSLCATFIAQGMLAYNRINSLDENQIKSIFTTVKNIESELGDK